MVKLNRIYTRTGDDGKTGLADGSRVSKTAARVAAYGTVDEANGVIGLARLHTAGEADAMLARIQNELFDVGADLATPDRVEGALRAVASQTARLEAEIDAMNATLDPLNSFILPGGSPASAWLHLARTVVRRAERLAVEAAVAEPINPEAIAYLNRLSDHLFVLARAENDGRDVLWVPGASR
ncbi:cob(I)yrinic acid a,c-diamide adenosyltransferase [Glacieibacterium frigidum]|uniref:Corrinoid adenosyltransferase n=1 Tax=Glacieibacterium frigidum TaxID=2593303 RepID=A0A552U909_9SPHN|nr:cob(I)yrinic acid a,c-diamide adenosyltransferase [Glacieibacterium frigidum]TRW14701.1 cob(I)yrinic acid a,c-diamide adenosyltransferase [Glacieibacterium frigidum]